MIDPVILVVDDEKNIRRTLRMVLEGEGWEVVEAGGVTEAKVQLGQHQVAACLCDVRLGQDNGLEFFAALKAGELGVDADLPMIMISGHATVDDAVRAVKLGAFDFLEKPLDRERVIVCVRNALERRALQGQLSQLKQEVGARHAMVGQAPVMQELFRQIAKVGPTKGRVLITGESGTGKELIARAVHDASQQARAAFVKVNCAAIPPELIESELFGHERGAFTGAVGKKRGLFEVAHGGTIFLDEIGDMAQNAQAKVLRALQTGEINRVGGEKTVTVDVRVIAATNKDLAAEVAAGRFREDLFFRLNVVPIVSPPLRVRGSDIARLAEAFVIQCCEENGFRQKRLHPEVAERLMAYAWPGNVRELRNVIERLVIMSEDEITLADLPPYLGGSGAAVAPLVVPPPRSEARPLAEPADASVPVEFDLRRFLHLALREFRDESEKVYLRARLREFEWNISRASGALGIERTNLHKRLRTLGIDRHQEEGREPAAAPGEGDEPGQS
jgi:DNA-binding NtrC family response regulator